jgi:hypothetical protein
MTVPLPFCPSRAEKAIGEADELGDLFKEVSRGINELLWLVEAHLQAER